MIEQFQPGFVLCPHCRTKVLVSKDCICPACRTDVTLAPTSIPVAEVVEVPKIPLKHRKLPTWIAPIVAAPLGVGAGYYALVTIGEQGAQLVDQVGNIALLASFATIGLVAGLIIFALDLYRRRQR
ncbi:MAG: hypothetical protein AAFU85_32980 [Planctomycetota bacterium]